MNNIQKIAFSGKCVVLLYHRGKVPSIWALLFVMTKYILLILKGFRILLDPISLLEFVFDTCICIIYT